MTLPIINKRQDRATAIERVRELIGASMQNVWFLISSEITTYEGGWNRISADKGELISNLHIILILDLKKIRDY